MSKLLVVTGALGEDKSSLRGIAMVVSDLDPIDPIEGGCFCLWCTPAFTHQPVTGDFSIQFG